MSNYYAIHKTKKNDALMHWKYIKKVKKNGKWRYYYSMKDNELTKLQNQRKNLEDTYNRDFERWYQNRWNSDLRNTSNSEERKNVNRWYKDRTIKEGTKDTYGFYNGPGYLDRYRVDSAKYFEDKRAKSIGGKVDKFMAKNGAKMAKSLNKAVDAIEKGKKKVANLFK